MDTLKQSFMERYHLSNYQFAQLTFLWKTLASDISKLLIMGFIFHRQLPLYLYALSIMLMLRCSTGGLHFYTYLQCLAVSTIYLSLAMLILPFITLSQPLQIMLSALCIPICYCIGPVPSRYRTPYAEPIIRRCKITISVFILLYTLILFIMPESKYTVTGVWIIILHTLQLAAAKYIRKEEP